MPVPITPTTACTLTGLRAQQTAHMREGARPRAAGAQVAKCQPRLPLSAYLSRSSLGNTELLRLQLPYRTPICFLPFPCLQCSVRLEHIFPLISKYEHLQGHMKCLFSLHPSLAMYPLNLDVLQASLKQLVQTRMPKACSSTPPHTPGSPLL